jgi:hypothetical protein
VRLCTISFPMTTLADLTNDQRAQFAAAEALVRFAHRDVFRDAVADLLDHGLDLTVVIRMLTGVVPVAAPFAPERPDNGHATATSAQGSVKQIMLS